MQQNSFYFKKSLGQNFLKDDNIIHKIVSSANINKDTLVIEIGPGSGAITKELVPLCGHLLLYEADYRLENNLYSLLKDYDNYSLNIGDFLKTNISKDIVNYSNYNIYVVANLPYYITTPIIMKLLEENLDIESITVMIQKEVADRLIAIPGDKLAGAITYTVYYYCESEKIIEVPNNSFIPEPEVTSEVIKLKVRKNKPVQVDDEKEFFSIIKCAFMQRRKTLLNSLTNNHVFENKTVGETILKELDFDLNVRPECLAIDDFARIYNKIKR